jgi:hypothetical protein
LGQAGRGERARKASRPMLWIARPHKCAAQSRSQAPSLPARPKPRNCKDRKSQPIRPSNVRRGRQLSRSTERGCSPPRCPRPSNMARVPGMGQLRAIPAPEASGEVRPRGKPCCHRLQSAVSSHCSLQTTTAQSDLRFTGKKDRTVPARGLSCCRGRAALKYPRLCGFGLLEQS